MSLIEMILFLFLTIVLLIAVISDIRLHKIPNWLTYPAMMGAIIYHTSTRGIGGFLYSVEGVGAGFAVLIIFYLMGGMGAGDVKLMGAVGGLLGPKGVLDGFRLHGDYGWPLCPCTSNFPRPPEGNSKKVRSNTQDVYAYERTYLHFPG